MVCELAGGDLLLWGAPGEPLAYLVGPDADGLRAALDAAFRAPRSEDQL